MISSDEKFDFWVSVLVYTILSGLGSSFIIFEILKSHRKDLSARLIMYLSIADFCLSFICLGFCAFHLHHGRIIPNSLACLMQPVITWYLMEASLLWLTTIAVHSAFLVIYNYKMSLRIEILFNLVCWGLPIITVIIPIDSSTGESYGDRNGLWCSFSPKDSVNQLVNLLVYYIPCLVIIVSCYSLIGYFAYKTFGEKEVTGNSRKEINIIVRRLFCYVLCYFVVWTPLVICYIYEANTKELIPYWAEYISTNLLHIQGIFNVVIYFLLNKNFLSTLKNRYFLLCTNPEVKISKDNSNNQNHSNKSNPNSDSDFVSHTSTVEMDTVSKRATVEV